MSATSIVGTAAVRIVGELDPGSFERSGRSITKTLGKAVLGIGAAVGAIGTAVGGIALTKGLSRVLDIQDAEKQMRALGFATDTVDQAMKSALNSVTGTRFALNEAAGTAAQFVAAGVPLERLEGILSAVAGTAEVAGTSMADVGDIFAVTAARGRVTGQELNRLVQRGIPVLQILADELGTTAEAVSEMVTAGELDFDTFAAAMESRLGDAAQGAAETVRGAMSLVGASLARLGARAAEPILEPLRIGALALRDAFDFVGRAIQPFLDRIADTGVIDRLVDRMEVLRERLQAGFAPVVIDVVAPPQEIFDRVFDGFSSLNPDNFGIRPQEIFDPAEAEPARRSFADMLTGMLRAAVEAVPRIVTSLLEMIPAFIDRFVGARQPIIDAAITAFTAVVDAIPVIVPAVVEGLVSLITQAVAALVRAVPLVLDGALQLFIAITEALPVVLPVLLEGVIDLVLSVVSLLPTLVPTLLDAAIVLLLALVEAVPPIIPPLVAAIVDLIPILVETLVAATPVLLEGGLELFTALLDAWIETTPQVIDAVIDAIPQIVDALVDAQPQIYLASIQLFVGLAEGLIASLPELLAVFTRLPGDIVKALNPRQALRSAGESLMDGLRDGVRAAAFRVVNAVRQPLRSVRNLLPFSEPRDSSSPLYGLSGSGESIIRELAAGMRREAGVLQSAMSGALGPVQATVTGTMPTGGTQSIGGVSGVSVGTVNVTAPSPREAARMVLTGISDAAYLNLAEVAV